MIICHIFYELLLRCVLFLIDTFNDFNDPDKDKCPNPCHLKKNCENCTEGKCMWCSNQQKCVETNAYVATFIYGQCMEWTTEKAKCPGNHGNSRKFNLCASMYK